MILEENTTKKNGDKTITNNITKSKITITDGENTTTLPYAIIAINEKTIITQQGQDIKSIPKIMLPTELKEIIETLTQPETKKKTNTKKSKTTIKGKKQAKKEEDEENAKK